MSRAVNEVALDRLFCNTEIRIHTPVVLAYDNSHDEQLEKFLFW